MNKNDYRKLVQVTTIELLPHPPTHGLTPITTNFLFIYSPTQSFIIFYIIRLINWLTRPLGFDPLTTKFDACTWRRRGGESESMVRSNPHITLIVITPYDHWFKYCCWRIQTVKITIGMVENLINTFSFLFYNSYLIVISCNSFSYKYTAFTMLFIRYNKHKYRVLYIFILQVET